MALAAHDLCMVAQVCVPEPTSWETAVGKTSVLRRYRVGVRFCAWAAGRDLRG